MSQTERVPFQTFQVTAVDLRRCGWQEAIAEVAGQEVTFYESGLMSAAKQAGEDGDQAKEHALALLFGVTSMYYDDDDLDEPYKPMFVTQSGRSPALADFGENHLVPISEFYQDVSDDELRARLADLLWVKKRDHVAARSAVAAYITIAKAVVDPERWTHAFHRIQRAMRIAGALGRDTPEKAMVTETAMEILRQLNGTDPLYLSRSLIQLLIDYRAGHPEQLAHFGQRCAESAEERQDWMVAGDYWSFTAQCLRKGGQQQPAQEALLRAGRAYINVGESMVGRTGLAADHWLERGFLLLREAGAAEEVLVAAQRRLEEVQRLMMENLAPIQTSTDIPPAIIEHLDQARGRTFREALEFMAHQAIPTRKSDLRDSVYQSFRDHPLSGIFGTNLLREGGKTDISMPPLSLDGQDDEKTVEQHMWRRNVLNHALIAWMVEYVRRILEEEHAWKDDCLEWLLQGNAFVPQGREGIYRSAIKAGLAGDFLVCTHLLVPQLENSFRFVLHEQGHVTTDIRNDGTHDERSLNKIVLYPAFEATFGEDLAFELRGILAERAGSNLRNATCHGLLPEGAFYSPENVLIFAHAVRLLIFGIAEESLGGTTT